MVELNAPDAANPARAMRLAREMRLRATLLELGPEATDEVAEFTAQMRTLSEGLP